MSTPLASDSEAFKLHLQLPWGSNLQRADEGLLGLHGHVNQYLIINLFIHMSEI